MTKVRCPECHWVGLYENVLTARNPFTTRGPDVVGCPQCFSVIDPETVCDEPGCERLASCGTPTPTGYRSTCGQHRPG